MCSSPLRLFARCRSMGIECGQGGLRIDRGPLQRCAYWDVGAREGGRRYIWSPLMQSFFTSLMWGFTLQKHVVLKRKCGQLQAFERALCMELNINDHTLYIHTHQIMVSQKNCATLRVLIFVARSQSPIFKCPHLSLQHNMYFSSV